MTWSDFYLICFIVGFSFSMLSLLAGGLHLDAHLPHWIDFAHHDFGSHGDAGHGDSASFFNLPTMMTFFAWFGGIGYLLTHVYGFWFLHTLGIALAGGVVGASLVFLFLAKVLMAHDHTMNPADYRIEGTPGTVSSAIRPGGTGEIVFSLGGARKFCSARSDDGTAIDKGTEIIIVRYDKGIAYVYPWERMIESREK
ncbi:MAG: NfeD family protein [Syntrophobacteraceae bacterium]